MDIALIGIGKIARDQHVPAIANSPDFTLSATVSRHGTVDGVEDYGDIDALLAAREDIRVVSLCLPPVPRFEVAAKALKAGRHLMLEKPPGATLSECYALEKLAREHGVSLYATWHSREADKVSTAKAWLADKTLTSLKVTWQEDVRRWHPGQDWIWQPGGMGVFDPGINALSIVTEILPHDIRLTDAHLFVPENCQTPIAADLTFAHPQGAKVTANLDFRKEGEQIWSIEVVTTDGTMTLYDGGAQIDFGGDAPVFDDQPLSGEYPRLYANMARLIDRGGIDMDLRPFALVADANLLGRSEPVEPFEV